MIFYLLKDRGHHFAGLAPVCIKVYEYGFVTIYYFSEFAHVFLFEKVPNQFLYLSYQTDNITLPAVLPLSSINHQWADER
jgi:hypothetical protein